MINATIETARLRTSQARTGRAAVTARTVSVHATSAGTPHVVAQAHTSGDYIHGVVPAGKLQDFDQFVGLQVQRLTIRSASDPVGACVGAVSVLNAVERNLGALEKAEIRHEAVPSLEQNKAALSRIIAQCTAKLSEPAMFLSVRTFFDARIRDVEITAGNNVVRAFSMAKQLFVTLREGRRMLSSKEFERVRRVLDNKLDKVAQLFNRDIATSYYDSFAARMTSLVGVYPYHYQEALELGQNLKAALGIMLQMAPEKEFPAAHAKLSRLLAEVDEKTVRIEANMGKQTVQRAASHKGGDVTDHFVSA